jgi:hypothetical protein
MSYTVQAQAGDCLCTIAQREGYGNCETLRSHVANAAFLDVPLQPGDQVTIPQAWNTWVYGGVATGRRWTVRWKWPVAPPQARQVRIIRKVAGVNPVPTVVQDLGISRFVTRSTSLNGNDNWVDHTQYGHDAASGGDPNTFAVQVTDPNVTATDVVVYLEALEPLYAHGQLNGHRRFQGNQWAPRTLRVTCHHSASLAAGVFWSPELRLVVDRLDQRHRPRQTLLVTDLFDDQGAGNEIQILDQDVRAVYEHAACPRNAGSKCLLGRHQVSLRRGRSVNVEIFVVRDLPDGTGNDNGLVQRAEARQHVLQPCRRMWAQEELTFGVAAVGTIDPPSDMLTVGDPDGATASGTRASGKKPSYVRLRVTIERFDGRTDVTDLAPVNHGAGELPPVMARRLATALGRVANVQARASVNVTGNGQANPSADVVVTCATGIARLAHITRASEDTLQKVEVVTYDRQQLDGDQDIDDLVSGGPPMRRMLFKSVATQPDRISVFVVRQQRAGLTTSALVALNTLIPAEVRNCMTLSHGRTDQDLADTPGTFAHEVGHALTDADHTDGTFAGDLMYSGRTIRGDWYDGKRVSGPGIANHGIEVVRTAGLEVRVIHQPPHGHRRLTAIQTTAHALIVQNTSLTFTNR